VFSWFSFLGIHLRRMTVTHGLAQEDSPERPLRAFLPWAVVCLVLWVSSMWLMFQPMEMRATLMSG
jgi:hypothetical protein